MNKTVLKGALATIVLGALGSALWELIKPGFSFVGSTAVTVTSFGINSLIDDVYTGAAIIGNPVTLWIKGTTLLLMGSGFVIYGIFLVTSNGSRNLATILMFMGIFLLTGAIRHTGAADVRGRFDFLRRVSAPYFTEDERLKIDSRLALVTGKAEFEKLKEEMRQRLRANGVTFSE